MNHFAIACLACILWLVICYSLAFSEGIESIGILSNIFLINLQYEDINGTIPESAFIGFQMKFAIITPTLIIEDFLKELNLWP